MFILEKLSSANNQIIDAFGYAYWIRRYNSSKVTKESQPESIKENYKFIEKCQSLGINFPLN
ncbi:hypothetical protein GAB14E_3798 [Colwellia psychrerythraea]|uniref:Uncharacterized protein n=1 Tax=Colwellia psychrerythraea TaxID=28229 RepID=A0A099KI27_COLPS|nr:hypothetical protein GAB14E_3798 [Colwellia psychrerythraea]